MKPEFPKPAREVLARQTVGEAHPSADELNAYVEQSLAPRERTQILTHLVACPECREVLFLAGGCIEEPVAVPSINPARPWLRWRWAVPAVALVTILSALLVQHRRTESLSQTPIMTATNRSPAPQAATDDTVSGAVTVPAPASAPASATSSTEQTLDAAPKASLHREAVAAGRVSSGVATPPVPRGAKAVSPVVDSQSAEVAPTDKTADTSPTSFIAQAPPVPDVSTRSGFLAPPQSPPEQTTQPRAMSPASRMRVELRAHWRITSHGHLERSISNGTWTRVLADEPVTFRVVAVVANDVWAGGSEGALFRSQDGGVNWQPVELPSAGSEPGSIVSIAFDTPQQGSVTTDAGSQWSTSDSGLTWTKH